MNQVFLFYLTLFIHLMLMLILAAHLLLVKLKWWVGDSPSNSSVIWNLLNVKSYKSKTSGNKYVRFKLVNTYYIYTSAVHKCMYVHMRMLAVVSKKSHQQLVSLSTKFHNYTILHNKSKDFERYLYIFFTSKYVSTSHLQPFAYHRLDTGFIDNSPLSSV